ncbi:MAG: nuclear transport factor 2 family protein [Gammaproteobacteria bacterium]|nr:nuclear transport factor 2 family protein [Gammaproteobacteria bacterium]
MKILLLLTSIIFLSQNLLAGEKEQILHIMSIQEKAWNNADLEGFMQAYWKSEELKFIGKSGIQYGWQLTLDNYKKSYPDKATMGTLHFDVLQIEIVKNTAFVLGKWQLSRVEDTLKGFYTLYWRKVDGQWKIIIDHSS